MLMNTADYHDLPVRNFYDEIVQSVHNNQVVIITAETGAGKSTQVPQYLAEAGYEKVIVTQPRILAARNLTRRVREEWAERHGEREAENCIGYRTAHERDDSGESHILYCTDGLQLVRELVGFGAKERQILVLDEVHEWNENMEVLVAWAKKRCRESADFKVVIMSATIEAHRLGEYFGTNAILEVPGRTFEVKKRRGRSVLAELQEVIASDRPHNVLVFLPGKAEIEDAIFALKGEAAARNIPLIPLHSQLEASMQQAAFESYEHGKIILSTNIAQTSVTIDDIDLVIDSGLERRSEVRSGVEGLFLAQISQADCLQRAGRAGRTKKGEYILAPYGTYECANFDDRNEYPIPEILRTHLDRLALRLAAIGLNIEDLDFYHDPSRKAIKHAKRTLIALGALTADGQITDVGRQMEVFPVESQYGRMLVEGKKLLRETQICLAGVIAVAEVGGVIKGGTKFREWRRLTRETDSDLLAQYEVYCAAQEIPDTMWEELGIISKNMPKAQETFKRLAHDLGLEMSDPIPLPQGNEREGLLKALVAGQLRHVWQVNYKGDAIQLHTRERRQLSSSTVLKDPRLVVGEPFDLEIPLPSGGRETLHLVQSATKVRPHWLKELAPKSFQINPGNYYYDSRSRELRKAHSLSWHGQKVEISGERVDASEKGYHQKFVNAYAAWVFDRMQLSFTGAGRKGKSRRFGEVHREVAEIVGRASSADELSRDQREAIGLLIRGNQRSNRDGDSRGHPNRRKFYQKGKTHQKKYNRSNKSGGRKNKRRYNEEW